MAAFGAAALDLSAGLVTVPFLPESLLRAVNNVLQLNEDWDLLASYFGGIGLADVRLNSASTRIRGFPRLIPFQATAVGGSLPAINNLTQQPIRLAARENVSVQGTNGAANDVLGLLWLSTPNNPLNVNVRSLRWIRFTASVPTVAYAWSAAANIILDDSIEAGNYKVYGMIAEQATGLAARLIFNNQVERPGCLCTQALTDQPAKILNGELGEWGQFESITPPMLEVVANAAATVTFTGYILCGK